MLENGTGSIIQCGRKISDQEIEQIKETVDLCWRLSRYELARTIAENLGWYTASGSLKVDACVKLLEKLQAEGVLQLPEKRCLSKPNKRSIPITPRSAPAADIDCKLKQLDFVKLQILSEPQEIKLWQEYVKRYHYLGYKKPFGYYLHYFIGSDRGILGCLLFSGAAKSIGVRDRWIGWTSAQRLRNLAWVINNSRFLIFPWVKVANLASHVLGQIHKQIRAHFKQRWGFCPVLLETFVDPQHYRGSCYKAANWRYLGMTTGLG
ncbi:MAG: Druantia anti-phage system protein DruA, partial [Desulfobacterales bacterium]